MKNGQPYVSIIIATFNSEKTLEQSLKSAINQNYDNFELIVIDGGSSDSTNKIVERNREYISYAVSEGDKGVYDAWNKGLKVARGDWICFIGSDDYFSSNNVLQLMDPDLRKAQNDHRQWVYGRVKRISESQETIEIVNGPWEEASQTFKNCMNIYHAGSFHHRQLFETHGLFDDNFRLCGDYELILRSLKTSAPLFVNHLVLNMRCGGLTSDLRMAKLAIKETEIARKKNGITNISWKLKLRRIALFFFLFVRRIFGNDIALTLADGWRLAKGKKPMWRK